MLKITSTLSTQFAQLINTVSQRAHHANRLLPHIAHTGPSVVPKAMHPSLYASAHLSALHGARLGPGANINSLNIAYITSLATNAHVPHFHQNLLKDTLPSAQRNFVHSRAGSAMNLADSQRALSQWFWNKNLDKDSLIGNIRKIASMDEQRIPSFDDCTLKQDEAIFHFMPLFESLSVADIVPLTRTERFLLDEAHKEIYGSSLSPFFRPMRPSMVQSAGHFDQAALLELQAQVETYVESVAKFMSPDVVLRDLSPDERHALVEKMIAAAGQVLKSSSDYRIVVATNSCPDGEGTGPGTLAVTYPDQEPREIVFYPEVFQMENLDVMGLVLHEWLHLSVQTDQSLLAKEDQDIGESRQDTSMASIEGPRISRQTAANGNMMLLARQNPISDALDYPTGLETEREAWALELFAKVYATGFPAFSSTAKHVSVYADVAAEGVTAKGTGGLLSTFAKKKFGLDMAKLAVFSGVRQGDADSGQVPRMPFKGLKAYLHARLATDHSIGATQLLSTFRAHLLGDIRDVLDAARSSRHPNRRDAQLLVLAVHDAVGLAMPFKTVDWGHIRTFEELCTQCRRQSEELKTPLGRTLLYQFAARAFKKIEPQADPQHYQELKQIIGMPKGKF